MSRDLDSDCIPKTPEEIAEAKQLISNLKRVDEGKNRMARWTCNFIRPEILAFAEAMELTMRKHDPKKGDSYKTCPMIYLGGKVQEEYQEFEEEFLKMLNGVPNNLNPELVDLGICCVMTWNRNKPEAD